jgi:circularin A/uberolysin family circular bacteriocin
MTIAQQRKQLLVWTMALVGVVLAFIVNQGAVLELYGKVNCVGVTYATLYNVVNAIVNGASIMTAVGIVGAFLAGPLAAALTAIGRGLIIKLFKRWGIKKLVSW